MRFIIHMRTVTVDGVLVVVARPLYRNVDVRELGRTIAQDPWLELLDGRIQHRRSCASLSGSRGANAVEGAAGMGHKKNWKQHPKSRTYLLLQCVIALYPAVQDGIFVKKAFSTCHCLASVAPRGARLRRRACMFPIRAPLIPIRYDSCTPLSASLRRHDAGSFGTI